MGREFNNHDVKNVSIAGTQSIAPNDEDRIIYLTGEICESSIAQAAATIFSLAAKDNESPIWLFIDTYGGSIDSMFSLYDTIKFVSCPIHTVGLGKIMSAGVLLLASGDKRYIGASARVMIHSIRTGMHGDIFEHRNQLNELNRLQEFFEEKLTNEIGESAKKINEIMNRKVDTFLSAKEAIELGIADCFLENQKSNKNNKKNKKSKTKKKNK